MVAYDYEAQKWVTGPEAVALLVIQGAEDAGLMKDPAFRAFIKKECCECGGEHDSEDCDGITCEACRDSNNNGDGMQCMECQIEGMAE